MWNYEKRLQYPVKITQTNPKIAQVIISQFGGLLCEASPLRSTLQFPQIRLREIHKFVSPSHVLLLSDSPAILSDL